MRVLAFGAHPDDIEIGCGGSLALAVRAGHSTVHAVFTSGEAGSSEIPPETLGPLREKEAREAGDKLGAHAVEFLRYPDGLSAVTREMKMAVLRLIRKWKPTTIYVHSAHDPFPDHRITHQAVLEALTLAAGPWFAEAGQPHFVSEVLGYEVWHPLTQYQKVVDISDVLPLKIEALRCHRSQMAGVRYDEAVQGLARYRGVMSLRGTYAEVFEVLRSS